MTATRLPPVDAVVIGMGWTGAIMARALTGAGLKVVGLERGRMRDTEPDFALPQGHDELRYALRHELMQDLSRETITFRNSNGQTALPMRQYGSFLFGDGVGGAGVHWNGQTFRFHPRDFRLRSFVEENYGAEFIPADMTLQDWGVTYDELEPGYDRFEYLCGISGKAGNIAGRIQPGGNPFEGPRSRDYPTPPLKNSYAGELFAEAATGLGLHPFRSPSAALSQPYTNPDGQDLNACIICGFCGRFGCGMAAKASPQTTILPLLQQRTGFTLRTQARVTRILTDTDGTRATGVTYVDAQDRLMEQPADLVLLCAFGLNNVRLLLLSGIGAPYDPKSGAGVVGRNYAYQTGGGSTLWFDDKVFNVFMGAGALGTSLDDEAGGIADHATLGFIGGGSINLYSDGVKPIEFRDLPPGLRGWGGGWKRWVAQHYNRTISIGCQGSVMPYRDVALDLDPTYRDEGGDPLLRLTFDWHADELAMSQHVTGVIDRIAAAMKPAQWRSSPEAAPYSIAPYQSTHCTGGAIMGTDPRTSVVNRYLQSWDVPNLFVIGASAFPQNAAYGPTATLGALAFWSADAIIDRYLKAPGPLAGHG
jgi:gluconate 2-dehydrogenase alpha chain